ncbi:hypothetical protein GCM10011571_30920 [Marinithermofilum abyssi]|uniref:Uncharacterized protein n=1 Tax=Marinithermofilum abyssi TaxID=1571185 RepID=A0A8J2YES5_9BACL|nr:hypothetical protein [Marinithermofilum abyssi]GGE26523.1 hypothetical protein GCM10011571_30920 [Marinithermofilum abyssi]
MGQPNESSIPPSVQGEIIQPHKIGMAQYWLAASLRGEEALLTLSAQLSRLPATRALARQAELQEQNLRSTGCRMTAFGCLKRMAQGDWHESVIATLASSMVQGRKHDRIKRGYLLEMKRSAKGEVRTAVENMLDWVDYTETHLTKSMVETQQSIGIREWNRWAGSAST